MNRVHVELLAMVERKKGGVMIKQTKRIDSDKVMAAAKRSLDFWATIDGNKLAKVGQNEKEMDIVGPRKEVKSVKYA